MTAPSDGRPLGQAVTAAVGRVLELNPALLRPDTPLADMGGDDVALLAIADLLVEAGLVEPAVLGTHLASVHTMDDLLRVVEQSLPTEPGAATQDAR